VEALIRFALFCAFAALGVGVVLAQLRRIRRIRRHYSDPATIARLLADEPPGNDAGRGDRDAPPRPAGRDRPH